MGASLSWLAVRTESHSRLFELASIAPLNETVSSSRPGIYGGSLEGGWFLLQAHRADHRIIHDSSLKAISELGSTIACSVEEHVMHSSSSRWEAGAPVWAMAHRGDHDVFHLESSGNLPHSFEALRQGSFRQQEAENEGEGEVDFVFDLPLLLAKEPTGYKHDEESVAFVEESEIAFSDLLHRAWWKLW